MTPVSKSGSAAASKKRPTNVPELIAALENSNAVTRRKARETLVVLGRASVPSLIQLLSHRRSHVRWEAAKALGGIADPIAASALVGALKDRDGDVRWLAAEGLAALGQDALHPLLAALIERHESDWLCEGAHHVCHSLTKKKELGHMLQPLLTALGKSESEDAASAAAYAALAKLRDLSPNVAKPAASKSRKS